MDDEPFELFPNDIDSPAGAVHDAAGGALTICATCLAHKWDDPELAVAQAAVITDGQGLCLHHWQHAHDPQPVRHDQTDRHRYMLALGIISELRSTRACWYDARGRCVTHNLAVNPCPHARAQELLANPEDYRP